MKCPVCYNEQSNNSRFCDMCGAHLGGDLTVHQPENHGGAQLPSLFDRQPPYGQQSPPYGQQPPPYGQQPYGQPFQGRFGNAALNAANQKANASLYLGIAGIVLSLFGVLCCVGFAGPIISVVGLIMGLNGGKELKNLGASSGTADTGFILSIIGIVIGVAGFILYFVLQIMFFNIWGNL